MWWKEQNFGKPIKGKDGKIWSFLIWHGHIDRIYTQRIFFWDEEKENTGILEFKDEVSVHKHKLKDKMIKLVNDKVYREKYQCDLKFPIEKNY